jgi:hypothetical protein
VALGYHTLPQVVAGWLAGSGGAALWHAWGHRAVLPLVQQHPALQVRVCACCCCCLCCCWW